MSLTNDEILDILKDISQKTNFQGKPILIFFGTHEDNLWVQVGMSRLDCDDPDSEPTIGKGGKVYISNHATEDEVVKKVLGLCLAYVEHEMREGFYYKDHRLFGPHISIDAMIEASKSVVGRS